MVPKGLSGVVALSPGAMVPFLVRLDLDQPRSLGLAPIPLRAMDLLFPVLQMVLGPWRLSLLVAGTGELLLGPRLRWLGSIRSHLYQ